MSEVAHDCHCFAHARTSLHMFAMNWFVKSCQELVYGQKYDGALRTAQKRPEPILEVLEQEVVKLVLENITKQSKLERGEPLDTRVQLVPDEDDGKPGDDFIVALEAGNLTVDHVSKMCDDDTNIVKDHQDLAIRHVQMNVKLVDGSMADRDIISAIKMSSFGTFDGGNLLIFYDVKSSGEDARRPDRRKAALRRQHLDRLVRLVLRSRLGDSDGDLFIQQSDIFVFFDAGRHGNVHSFMGSLKNEDDKAVACCPTRRMLNM